VDESGGLEDWIRVMKECIIFDKVFGSAVKNRSGILDRYRRMIKRYN
jgi:hypothetical protein